MSEVNGPAGAASSCFAGQECGGECRVGDQAVGVPAEQDRAYGRVLPLPAGDSDHFVNGAKLFSPNGDTAVAEILRDGIAFGIKERRAYLRGDPSPQQRLSLGGRQ